MLLSVVLLGIAGALAWHLRTQWLLARQREQFLLQVRSIPVDVPVPAPSEMVKSVSGGMYAAVAQQVLFATDRNPTVIIDPPKAEPPPPPPPPDPPLPSAYGVMAFFGPPAVIMTAPGSNEQKSYREGDQVGEYKIKGITNEVLTFEWNGKTIEKKLAELKPKPAELAAQAQAAAAMGANNPNAPAAAPPPPENVPAAPDTSSGSEEVKACLNGDTSPEGTVSGGYRKVFRVTPFGRSCAWIKVN